jgi:hypothetical protein
MASTLDFPMNTDDKMREKAENYNLPPPKRCFYLDLKQQVKPYNVMAYFLA